MATTERKRGSCAFCGHSRSCHMGRHGTQRGACQKKVDKSDPTGGGVCACRGFMTARDFSPPALPRYGIQHPG